MDVKNLTCPKKMMTDKSVIALLNQSNSGVVINGIYSRDGSYTYAKPIIEGKYSKIFYHCLLELKLFSCPPPPVK